MVYKMLPKTETNVLNVLSDRSEYGIKSEMSFPNKFKTSQQPNVHSKSEIVPEYADTANSTNPISSDKGRFK